MEKVMIAAPINSVKDYCLDDFIKTISSLDYVDKQLYLVDNSDNLNYHVENVILKYGVDCDWVNPKSKKSKEIITESQNLIRKKFLMSDCEYLLFIEQDITPPSNILLELISYQSQVSVARYFLGTNAYPIHLIGTEIEKTFGKETNRNISTMEDFIFYGKENTPSEMFGFGVILFHRDILRQTSFFTDTNSKAHSDTSFYFFLKDRGIKVNVHNVICKHNNSDWSKIKNYIN